MNGTSAKRHAPCPQCGEAAELGSDNPWRPFCCRRCKLVDLGAWLEERHVIAEDDGDGHPGGVLPGSGRDGHGPH